MEVIELLYTCPFIGSRSTQSFCSWLRNGRRYASITWFTLSVCPSVWQWKAVDIQGRIPVKDRKSFQVLNVNVESRSDTISWGRLWRRQISRANMQARSSAVFLVSSSGMQWAILGYRSITTHHSVPSFDWGRSVIKSLVIDCHGVYGSSRWKRSPYLLWQPDLSLWQSGQAWT